MHIVTNLERLREIALDQHGFVTTREAENMGVSRVELSKMVSRGRLTRVSHGVYRVPQVAETEFDQYHQAVLWTGLPEATLSHETALSLWELSDINPENIYLTVAPRRRVRRSGNRNYVLHLAELGPTDMTRRHGIPVVTAHVAISQCITSGTPTYLLQQAYEQARERGHISPEERDRLATQLESRDRETRETKSRKRAQLSFA